MGFTKLDEGILQSSIMAEDPETFKVWIALLAACKQDGIAYVSPVFLSAICRLPLESVLRSLDKLTNPDPLSRSIAQEGRRAMRVDGGYEIINYQVYRDNSLRSAERERKRLYREELRGLSGQINNCPDASASASASSFTINKEKNKGGCKVNFNWTSKQWEGISPEKRELWRQAYPACDIDIELARATAWLLENPDKGHKSRWGRFVTNWLSRSQDRGGTRGGAPAPEGTWLRSRAGKGPEDD